MVVELRKNYGVDNNRTCQSGSRTTVAVVDRYGIGVVRQNSSRVYSVLSINSAAVRYLWWSN